jgi:phosphate transporter
MYSATQEDELGQLYLSNVDFLKNGVPASMIAALVSFSRVCSHYG